MWPISELSELASAASEYLFPGQVSSSSSREIIDDPPESRPDGEAFVSQIVCARGYAEVTVSVSNRTTEPVGLPDLHFFCPDIAYSIVKGETIESLCTRIEEHSYYHADVGPWLREEVDKLLVDRGFSPYLVSTIPSSRVSPPEDGRDGSTIRISDDTLPTYDEATDPRKANTPGAA